MGKLTVVQVRNLTEPGRYSDGQGLMLVVAKDGSRKWVLRVQADGRRRDFGLGAAAQVTLAEARDVAATIRKQVKAGQDPRAERRRARETIPTFRDAALRVHDEHRPSWKNAKHAAQWLATLEQHAFPALGSVRVDKIDGPMVRDVLADIWLKIPETARRGRPRIGAVLDWAHGKGYRPFEAPI